MNQGRNQENNKGKSVMDPMREKNKVGDQVRNQDRNRGRYQMINQVGAT